MENINNQKNNEGNFQDDHLPSTQMHAAKHSVALLTGISVCDAALVRWKNVMRQPHPLMWLDAVGGIAFSSVETQEELFLAAQKAPDEVTFGLAYGYIVDWLAFSGDDSCRAYFYKKTNEGARVKKLARRSAVLLRADHFIDQLDFHSGEFDDYLSPHQSKESSAVLLSQLKNAPTDFAFGVLTSWIINHQRFLHENGWSTQHFDKAFSRYRR